MDKKVLGIVLTLFFGALLYFASPKITEQLAIRYLETLGGTNISFKAERPGLQGIHINRIEARWQGFDFQIQGVELYYTIGGLLSGQVSTAYVRKVVAIAIPDTQAIVPTGEETYSTYEIPIAVFNWPELADALPKRLEISEILMQNNFNELFGELLYFDNTLSMRGKVHNQQLPLEHNFTFTIDQQPMLELLLFEDGAEPEARVRVKSKPAEPGVLHVQLSTGASFLSNFLQPDVQVSGALALELQLQAPWQESGSLTLEDVQISSSIAPGLKIGLPVPGYEMYSAQAIWNKTSNVTVSSRHIEVAPGPEISFSGPDLGAELSLAKVHVEFDDFFSWTKAELSILPGASFKQTKLINDTQLELSLTGITLTADTPISATVHLLPRLMEVKAAAFTLEIPHFDYRQQPYQLRPLIIETPDIHFDPENGVDLTIHIRNENNSLDANINVKAENEFVTSNTRLSLESQNSFINDLFSTWNHNFDASGTLTVNLLATINRKSMDISNMSGMLMIEQSSLFLDGVSAVGIDVTAPFRTYDTQLITDWVHAKVRQANVGVQLNNIEGSLRYTPSKLNIGPVKMQLLGGEAHSQALDYTFGSPSADTQINFSNLLLPRMVALADDEVEASGIIDGSIRLKGLFRENATFGLLIEEGSLSARAPGGLIRYVIGNQNLDLAKQSDFDFALTALENFDYQQLDSSITLSEDGELKLGVKLLGSNPQVKNGRPIQYNLNIGQNLFTLMRSLQLSNKLSNRIGEKLAE